MNDVTEAVRILRRGGLVAFPTETVYGLGADATNAEAVRRIFAAKGRPSTNPLIIHVADATVARRYAATWPQAASQLTQAFWPGPLTLVLPRNDLVVPDATAGKNTLGLRAPDHPLTLELLRQFDGPVAGPSANRSTRVSPTTAQHVHDELGDSVDLILDGGPCRVGIESTVLDLSRPRPAPPIILRPGGISREQIEAIIGPVDVFTGYVSPTTAAASPGQHRIHYAPHTPTYRFQGRCPASAKEERFGFILLADDAQLRRISAGHVNMPRSPRAYAHHLYAVLHEMDAQGFEAIYLEMPPDEPQWAAVRDRLYRATREI